MSEASPRQIREWSEEVARNPESPVFVPLADAYRSRGKLDAALRVLLRGLGRNPQHIEGHAVLARVYMARGDREKAFDEWHAINDLEPGHFEARRGLGFGYLERGDAEMAVEHLERAAELRPGDEAVGEALALARERVEAPDEAPATAAGEEDGDAPDGAPGDVPDDVPSPGETGGEPRELFAGQLESRELHGVILLDSDGLVVGGRLRGERSDRADEVAAVLSGATDEAVRTARHLELGEWKGILLEMEEVKAYLSPVAGNLLLVAAEGSAPVGWLKRVSAEAREAARRFLTGGAPGGSP